MNDRKRVLIISTMFPPKLGSGVQRVLGFFKYLPDFGWEPHVLTVVPGPYYSSASRGKNPPDVNEDRVTRTPFVDIRLAGKKFLLRATGKPLPAAPGEVVKARATGERFSRLLWALANTVVFVPDPEIGWYRFGVRAGLSTIRNARIDAILSSGPPFTSHLIAGKLKRLTGKRWVADFRDPWSQRPYSDLARFHCLRRPVDRFLERKVMRAADTIVTVSGPIADGFTRLGTRGIERKVRVITNGYDPEDFREATRRPPSRFTLCYTGTFIGEAASPVPLVSALAELIEQGAIKRDRVRVRIAETFPQDTARLARRYGLSDIFTVRAGLSHAEAVREQRNASVLLLVVRNDARGIEIYTGKLFEYLASRRPILALAPREGVAAGLIREANAGVVVNPEEPREIKEAILKYYLEHEQSGDVPYGGKDAVVRRYERPALAGQLAATLNSVLSR